MRPRKGLRAQRIERGVDPDIVVDVAFASLTSAFEVGIFERPGWIALNQRDRVFVRATTREYAPAQGEAARSPFAQRLDMRAAMFGEYVGVEMVPPAQERQLHLQKRRAHRTEADMIECAILEGRR